MLNQAVVPAADPKRLIVPGGAALPADARLIAAAPDLLAALRGLVLVTDVRGDSESEDAYQTRRAMLPQQIARARAAIARATGA